MARLAKGFNDMALQVQRSNQVLKAFVANVSHDLRTPLTMIIGFSQALIDGTARREEVTDSAAVIHDEALKMERLVDDLLQLTRLESGLMTLDRHPVEVQAFLGSVVERALHGYGQVSLPAFQIDAQNSLPPIDVDSAQIERALRNLLNNAVQHTPATGTITIQAKRSEDTWVEIGIRDTGTGIPAEEISRVFERFYRTDKGRDRGEEGHAGLGLAIVREIIEAHGGHVWVDSEPGAGSTFCFTVPTAASVGMAAQPVRDADSLRQAAG